METSSNVQKQDLQRRRRHRGGHDASAPRSADAASLLMGMASNGPASSLGGGVAIASNNSTNTTNNNLLLGMKTVNSSNKLVNKMDNDSSHHHHNASLSGLSAPASPKARDRRHTSGRWFQFQHWRRRSTVTSTRTVRKMSCWEASGLNFIIPALSIWLMIVTVFFWQNLKDSAMDYYYLQYPEQQPQSPIPGTILPLLPNAWIYQPPVVAGIQDKKDNTGGAVDAAQKEEDAERRLQRLQQQHHQQPHYYMLPQDYFEQQPASSYNYTKPPQKTSGKIRGVLIILHACHQTGLHVFQLPESRILVAQALQRGLAVLAPTSSAAAVVQAQQVADSPAKSVQCWNVALDKPMLGNMLYQWAHEQELSSLPRMAVGVSGGANLLISGSLYKTLRLSSMALYASHHPDGFHAEDLEQDVVPPTAFLVFPRNLKATEYAEHHYHTLKRQLTPQDTTNIEQGGDGKNPKQPVDEEVVEEEESTSREHGASDNKIQNKLPSIPPTQLWRVQPHPWTVELCQERMPEFHVRCRTFFRHIQKYQQAQQLRHAQQFSVELSKKKKEKRARKNNAVPKPLLSAEGEVLQSSKSPHWGPILDDLGLDDWRTHMMAFANVVRPKRRKSPSQQLQTSQEKGKEHHQYQPQRSPPFQVLFPTSATPDGRSWLWASMLQEIEVAYGLSQMTSEHSLPILMFLMHHAGIAQQPTDFSASTKVATSYDGRLEGKGIMSATR